MDETEFNFYFHMYVKVISPPVYTSLTHRGPERKKRENDGIAKEDHVLTSMCMWKEKRGTEKVKNWEPVFARNTHAAVAWGSDRTLLACCSERSPNKGSDRELGSIPCSR
jgi:hypothetical protein